MYTRQKLIIAGDVAHLYEYKKPLEYGEREYKPRRSEKDNTKKRTNSHIYRTKRQVKLLLQSNAYQDTNRYGTPVPPQFYTFTFAENVKSVTEANRQFRSFTQRLNYQIFETKLALAKYLTVPEFQKRGAVHYHTIYFNLPYKIGIKKEIQNIWSNGWVFAKKVNNLQHLTNYVSKYFTKDSQDDRLNGRKAYFCSKGLKKPIVVYNSLQIKSILPLFKNETFSKEYILGEQEVKYKCFDCSIKAVDNSLFTKAEFMLSLK